MATRPVFELWPDVSALPQIELARADLYFRFPVKVTAERAEVDLRMAGYEIQYFSDPFVFRMPDVEPLPPLRALVGILTPAEREETFALAIPTGQGIELAHRILAMNVRQLRDRMASSWLLEVLRSQSLSAVFQPIVSANDREIYGHEALLRGHHDRREISPARMIEVARSTHVMGHLDALATQVVLTEAARCNITTTIFVNCSPAHMYDPEFRMNEVRAFCDRLGLDASKIVFEIMETEMNDPEQVRTFIAACRHHGFRVALDDLGAGYSSLGVLHQLRPDIIKIDRGLISAIDTDPYRALILNRLLEATRILHVPTVIEGIETEAELAWARNNGATYVQGNLLGSPAPC